LLKKSSELSNCIRHSGYLVDDLEEGWYMGGTSTKCHNAHHAGLENSGVTSSIIKAIGLQGLEKDLRAIGPVYLVGSGCESAVILPSGGVLTRRYA